MPHLSNPTHRGIAAFLTTLLTGVIALVAMLLGAGAASASSPTTAATTGTGWIRTGHLSPGTPKVDVRLTPYSGGAQKTLTNVSFGEVTAYTRVPVGLYTVALVPAGDGTNMSVSPMISRSVQVARGAAYTVIATGTKGDVRATVLDDDLQAPPAGEARVRLVSAATTAHGVTAQVLGGPLLARGVTTGSSTGYADVEAQTWSVQLSATSGQDVVTERVPVAAGGVYTLVALDGAQGALELRAVKDATSSTSKTGAMPRGGVETGGGGLAYSSRTPGPDASAVAEGVVALLLLGLVGAYCLRRAAG